MFPCLEHKGPPGMKQEMIAEGLWRQVRGASHVMRRSLECVLQPVGRAERREKVHLTWQVQDSWGGWVRAQGPQLRCPGEILRGGSLGATEERPEAGKDMYPVGEGGRSWVPSGSSCWALAGHMSSRCRPDLLTQHM